MAALLSGETLVAPHPKVRWLVRLPNALYPQIPHRQYSQRSAESRRRGSKRDRQAPGLDNVEATSGNQPAMCFFGGQVSGGARPKQGRSRRIEHCIVGTIAGTINVASIKQEFCRIDGAFCFRNQVARVQSFTPSRLMLCSNAGLR